MLLVFGGRATNDGGTTRGGTEAGTVNDADARTPDDVIMTLPSAAIRTSECGNVMPRESVETDDAGTLLVGNVAVIPLKALAHAGASAHSVRDITDCNGGRGTSS